jgi:hypothetical protein
VKKPDNRRWYDGAADMVRAAREARAPTAGERKQIKLQQDRELLKLLGIDPSRMTDADINPALDRLMALADRRAGEVGRARDELRAWLARNR